MKVLLARHRLFCSTGTSPLFFWGGVVMEIVYDEARVESIDSFLRGKDLGLMPINKLEQLRKYIFNMEIERVPVEKKNFLELTKLFRYKIYHVGINRLYDSLIEDRKKSQKKAGCCHFERIKNHRSYV